MCRTTPTTPVLKLMTAGLTFLALNGCQPPSQRSWEMVFTTDQGKVLLTTVTTGALFAGTGPRVEATLATRGFATAAWHDRASGRWATVEKVDPAGEVVRVYDAQAAVLAEYAVQLDVVGGVCRNPCLSPGGRRVAFLGDLGVVFWADVGGPQTGRTHKFWQIWSTAPDTSTWNRSCARKFGRCYWLDDQTLAVGLSPLPGQSLTYRLEVESGKAHALVAGDLAGTARGSPIVVKGFYPCGRRFKLADATHGATLGSASAAHQYCEFERVSPCGDYVITFEPGTWFGGSRLIAQHWPSGRRAVLKTLGWTGRHRWALGSWEEIGAPNRPAPVSVATEEPSLPATPERPTNTPPVFVRADSGNTCLQLLTWANGAAEVELPPASPNDVVLTEPPTLPRTMSRPSGIAARDGVVYVCDSGGACICRLDYRNHTYTVFGNKEPARLREPRGLVIDSEGRKYVADPGRKRVVIFDAQDTCEAAFELPNAYPIDVAVREDELYVLSGEWDNPCSVLVLNRATGEVLGTLGGSGQEPGQFDFPTSLCVDSDGCAYVGDIGTGRIQKLSRDGTLIWAARPKGFQPGLEGITGLRMASDDTLFALNGKAGNRALHRLSPDGHMLMAVTGSYRRQLPGSLAEPLRLTVDATSLPYLKDYIAPGFHADYLLLVTGARGSQLVSVYAYGNCPPESVESASSPSDQPSYWRPSRAANDAEWRGSSGPVQPCEP